MGATGRAPGISRVRGTGLERTCRLKPILGRSASREVTLFGPKHRLRGHSRGARWENLVGGACRNRGPERFLSSPAFWAAVTLWRPSGPASHHRRGRSWVDWKGCDHADGAPAACLVAGTADRIALPEGARYDIVRSGTRGRGVDPAQCQTRHPGGTRFSAQPGRILSLSRSLSSDAVPATDTATDSAIGYGYGIGRG